MLVSLLPLHIGDVFVLSAVCSPRVFAQFDGSGIPFVVGLVRLYFKLLNWGSRAIPQCRDNIVAEAQGADLARMPIVTVALMS